MDEGIARADRILSRAVGMFTDHADPQTGLIGPGRYAEADSRSRVTVTLTVEDAMLWHVVIADSRGRTLFAATRTKDGPANVTAWHGGGWERPFTATDA